MLDQAKVFTGTTERAKIGYQENVRSQKTKETPENELGAQRLKIERVQGRRHDLQ